MQTPAIPEAVAQCCKTGIEMPRVGNEAGLLGVRGYVDAIHEEGKQRYRRLVSLKLGTNDLTLTSLHRFPRWARSGSSRPCTTSVESRGKSLPGARRRGCRQAYGACRGMERGCPLGHARRHPRQEQRSFALHLPSATG